MADRDWAATFREVFATRPSSVEARIAREVFGDEYPQEVEPHSFISRTDLRRIAKEVSVGAGDTLVDVGCGRGGPGLWVATRTGASLIGVDIADSAVDAARGRAAELGAQSTAEFVVGTFEHTSLPDGAAHAVLSVDALLFTPDKARALEEMARILRPGGRFVFTTWDYHSQPAGRPPQVDDHRPLLDRAGFEVLAYDETDDWRQRMRRFDDLTLQSVDELAAESGEPVEELRHALIEAASTVDTMIRRVLAVAVRRP